MSHPRRRGRAGRAALLGGAALAAACSGSGYDGISERVEVPRLTTGEVSAPSTGAAAVPAATTSTATSSTAPRTTAAPATSAPPATSASQPAPSVAPPPAPSTAPAASQVVAIGTTGVRIELPAGWQVEPATDPRTLLPVLAPAIQPSGLFDGVRLVATRRGTGRFVPSVMAFERPRGATDAIGTLAALRSLVGTRAASSQPAAEASRVGEGAYVTYQFTTTVDGGPVEVVSEHYAFLRPTSVLVLTMTTTAGDAATDGRAFGRMLASLTTAG